MKWFLWAAVVAFVLAGCSKDNPDPTPTPVGPTPTPSVSMTGVVVDGYLQGATAFLDLNRNGVLDAGEPSALTDANGNYALSVTPAQAASGASVVVEVPATAVDKDTGLAVGKRFVMSAPADSHAVISPMTTMVKEQMDLNAALTVTEAEENVKSLIGLGGTTVSLLNDYVASSQDAANPDKAKYDRVHSIARVSAAAVKNNLPAIETAAAGTGATLEDIIGVIVDKILAELSNIALQVDSVPQQTFNPDAALASTNANVMSTATIVGDVTTVQTAQQKPVIRLNGSNQVTVLQNSNYVDAGATARSNKDGDISNKIVVGGTVNTAVAGPYVLTYDVSDSASNAANQVLRVVMVAAVADTTAPVLTLNNVSPFLINSGTLFVDPGVTSDDPYAAVTVSGYVNSAVAGNYVITYSSVDGSGNAATPVQRIVTVADVTPPAAFSLLGANPMSVLVGSTFVEPGVFAWDAVDGDISANVVVTGGPVTTAAVGTFTLTYNVKDAANNAAVAITRTVNVALDATPPVVTAPPAVTVEATGPLTAVTLGSATATDNIDGTIPAIASATGPFAVGSYSIAWSATDSAGNTTNATQAVTVLDTTAPTITAPANITLEATGALTVATLGTASATDLTGTPTVSSNAPASFPVGVTNVIWTALDGFGNNAAATQTVTITDTTAPTLTLNGAASVTVTQGTAYADAGASASDIVDGTVAVTTTGTVNTSAIGAYTITYNASDVAGNPALAVVRTVNVVAAPVVAPLIALTTNGNSLNFFDHMDAGFAPVARQYVYQAHTFDAASGRIVPVTYSSDPATGGFAVVPLDPYRNTEITSTALGWQQIDTTLNTQVDNGAGAVITTRPDGITQTVTSVETPVAGQSIASVVGTQWGKNMVANAVFSAGASVVGLTTQMNADMYSIDFFNDGQCTPFGTGANCAIASYWDHTIGCAGGAGDTAPTVLNGILTLTGSQLPCAVAGVTNNKDLFVAQTANGKPLLAVLLAANVGSTTGTVNFYTGNNLSTEEGSVEFLYGTQSGTAVTPAATGVWNTITIGGSPAYVFDLPPTVALATWNQGVTKGFFTVQDGFVRLGLFRPQGAVALDTLVNQVAMADMVNNLKPSAITGNAYNYMFVSLDPYQSPGVQTSETFLELGTVTPNVPSLTMPFASFAAYTNGVASPLVSGSQPVQATWRQHQLQLMSGSPTTFDFTLDDEFAVGENVDANGAQASRLEFWVKKPTTAPTLASVAGSYRLVLLAQDNTLGPVTALAGYSENGVMTLDGAGGLTYTATNTEIIGGVPVVTPVAATNTYTVDPYGVVLNASGNAHLILSDNGQYGLYELHAVAGGLQEWGIAIKQHTSTIPFSAMTRGVAYDVHNQGAILNKALNVRQMSPSPAANTVYLTTTKAFAPAQLSPDSMCGVMGTPGCVNNISAVLAPVAPNVAASAANGEFTALDVTAVGLIPPLTSYISQDGGVWFTDDGEAGSIMIGIGR